MGYLVLIKFCFVLISTSHYCGGSFNEQYRALSVSPASSERSEAFILNDKEYIIQNLPVTWENAKILCRVHHDGSLAILDTREKADFLAEALSELQFSIESVWVGARRQSGDDPEGYRWGQGVELSRTSADVLPNELDDSAGTHYPMWLNRTHIPVPEGGADCVALERVHHDKPVFLDLACHLERPYVCERGVRVEARVQELKTVRCRTGLYHVYDGRMDWYQATAYCLLRQMALANISTMKCLKKLGLTMLKSRPSMESAWVGARGSLGQWTWTDSGVSIFSIPPFADAQSWPPMRLVISPGGVPTSQTSLATPSDDNYYYVLVKQLLYWQQAFQNCQKLNGLLATIDSNDILIQLLLVMGENKDQPIEHIWISGRLHMIKDFATDNITYYWDNPANGKRIRDPMSFAEPSTGHYMPPWLDEEFSMDSSCLNLDRQDHLNGLVYGLPCDTPQYSVCMIEKSSSTPAVDYSTQGYEMTSII